MKPKVVIFLIVSNFSLFFFNSCSSDDGTVDCFPTSTINTLINLNLPQYQELNYVGGYVETSGAAGEGTRGLIIVRNASGFVAYDRNAPHLCPGSNTTLEVVDDFYILCPNDGATWNLLDGAPINGTSNVSPRRYPTSYDPSTQTLLIRN